MARVLLIDDDRNLREVVKFILTDAGHEVVEAADGEQGVNLFDAEDLDLVLTDIRMPRRDGMEILRHVRSHPDRPDVPVIVLTAYGTVEQAVLAMKEGAFTYLLKPFHRDELAMTVAQALHTSGLQRENRNLRRLLRQQSAELPLVYASEGMEQLIAQVHQVAESSATVLISGESGTGKELIARAVHDLSPRWDKPFIAVNCGAIPTELLESELFGHARGAFTGAVSSALGRFRAADGGTLFLDEVGELPPALQPKLLRALETKTVDPVGGPQPVPVDFRLVCATNKDLTMEVRAGRFREDLYYRLEVVHLRIPPLRERSEDIPVLWQHFTRLHGEGDVHSEPALLRRLATLPWRGNVRELINMNQRLVLMRQADVLTVAGLEAALEERRNEGELQVDVGMGATGDGSGQLPWGSIPESSFSLPDLEKEIIRQALVKCDGNKSKAAAYLGIPRHVLLYRLRKYEL